jgi:two-component system chemotaxis response regulator CheB
MGADGCDGAIKMHQKGSTVWAQDQQSSTIYGMPMAVAKAGVADKILSLAEIGKLLTALK